MGATLQEEVQLGSAAGGPVAAAVQGQAKAAPGGPVAAPPCPLAAAVQGQVEVAPGDPGEAPLGGRSASVAGEAHPDTLASQAVQRKVRHRRGGGRGRPPSVAAGGAHPDTLADPIRRFEFQSQSSKAV